MAIARGARPSGEDSSLPNQDGTNLRPMSKVAGTMVQRARAWLPIGEFGRFILVGIWNTLFGYLVFALFNFLLSKRFPSYGYVLASGLSSIINITVAFLGYKWLVFKTSGNYLREWLRTVSVYSAGIALGIALLPVAVHILQAAVDISHAKATYLGALILTLLSALWNFLGNKNFSFKKREAPLKG
jgi:putative flippase GtrA